MNFNEYDYLFKILLIGDSGVGKSAILNRYCDDSYSDNYISTIGVDFKIKTINIDNLTIKIQIWDTAGQERFKSITSSYYRGAQAILCVYDMTDYLSFKNIFNIWLDEVIKQNEKNNSNPYICFVGTKSDLEPNTFITEALKDITYDHYETSAKKNIGVNKLFKNICKKLLVNINLIKNKKEIINVNTKNSVNVTKNTKCC